MVLARPALRPQQLRSAIFSLTSTPTPTPTPTPAAAQHIISGRPWGTRFSSSTTTRKAPTVPSPTPFIPDVATFLKVIGRNLSIHAAKFPTWESLFSLSSDQLRELGVEPPRTRKYLLRWRQKFRNGRFGPGGDLVHVSPEGTADLRILEVDLYNAVRNPDAPPTASLNPEQPNPGARPKKFVVNVPPGRAVHECAPHELSRVTGFRVRSTGNIVGPYALPLKGGKGARVAITEGMWEDHRGHKIDGGERRRSEVRYKKRIAERRERREQGI
ncbi:IGR protein motif-domain-containing protein [Xylariomycetidae sp. FL0641]|nr:IGR protein motif-domain-containing protein [Xylariomycetidae sp. FL0641]